MPITFTAATAPGALPLIGHGRQLMRDPMAFMESLSQYGDLVEIRIGAHRAHVPCHPELLRTVLNDDKTFDKGGPFFDRARDIVGNGLSSCPHRDHRRQRRLLQPSFSRTRLRGYGTIMEQEIAAMTGSWHNDQVVDAYPTFFDVFLRVVTRSLFSAHVDDATMKEIHRTCEIAVDGIVPRLFMPPRWQDLPLPSNRRYRHALSGFHAIVSRLIAQYRRDGLDHGDLLSTLVHASDQDGQALDDTEIRDQIITMIIGGSETSAAALCWSLHLLARHPDWARRLDAEVATTLGGSAAGHDDLPELALAARVVTETLRLYPPVWLTTRVTTAPVELGGFRLPAGATIVFAPSAVHRNRHSHHDPNAFDPDRWLPERSADLPRGAYMAFGAGARKCIGDVYGRAETAMALATIRSHWRIRPADGTDTRPQRLTVVYRPRRLLLRLSATG
ncbi:cytochrome P450 [Embleya sp. MST-111070]|uniref:cytochrome P450 n=1 Tax=Embleya sp. MST-111070 TaxID=3398231 RepID=UPI003F733512